MPSQADASQIRLRISAEFSPIPAVKTRPSSAAEDGGKRANLLGGPVDEIVDRQTRHWFAPAEQVSHVVADARDPEQPRLLVEHRLDLFGAEPEVLKEIEDDTGVERSGPCSHAEAVEGREAERTVHALAVLHRAHAGAAAEMRDDHAAAGDLRRFLRQHRGDVLVGQPVEAVALDARRADLARQRHDLGDRRLTAIESSCRSTRPVARREAAP